MRRHDLGPHIVVFSSVFPSARQPAFGLFVRERMFRVGGRLPLAVISPSPWFPLQGLFRLLKPGFRLGAARFERQDGFDVWHPRFLSVPGILKRFDGLFMALGAVLRMRRLKREGRLDIIDAHFAYPDGYAASLLGRWLGVPVTITLRGTETRHARDPALIGPLQSGLRRASRIFAVSESLRQLVMAIDPALERVKVVGNGVDAEKFSPIVRNEARRFLGFAGTGPALVTVGGLVERKGFHRVIECIPALRRMFPDLEYLAIGGATPEGNWTERIEKLVDLLELNDCVHLLGEVPPEKLKIALSASDVFVLATRNEGWANVLLEAMACGLPVVATNVGGNAEVVCSDQLGIIVPFGDREALADAITVALTRRWDRAFIRQYALRNSWDRRIDCLVHEFQDIASPTVAVSGVPEI